MSLHDVRDEFLARRAQHGDDGAFAELARRYEPLIAAASRRPPDGLDADDGRQAALIGLYQACRSTDGVRSFAGIAGLRVRWNVAAAGRAARARKQRILTQAVRDDDEPDGALARIAAPAGTNPARVVELREELHERLREHAKNASRRRHAPGGDLRRRYSDEQVQRAIAMVTNGSTVAAAAAAVGARYGAVREWVNTPRNGQPAALVARRARVADRDLHRRYSDEQISRARALLAAGHTTRGAAAAIGASHSTVLRWLRQAA